MKQKLYTAISAAIITTIITGCGGSSGYENPGDSAKVYKLDKQNGTQNYLFYGATNHKGLGSLQSVTVIDQNQTTYVDVNDTSDIRYPVLSTKCTYNASGATYSDLYVDRLSYVSEGKAYSISMKKIEGEAPIAVQNSNANKLSDVAYEDISYLGITQYLTAHNDETNETVLITPDMEASDAAIAIGDRKFLTVTYPSFGAPVDGYLFYDNTEKEVQKCSLDMQSCNAVVGLSAGSRDFEGDIAGTTYSVFFTGEGLFRVDKRNGTVEEIGLDGHAVASGHGTTSLKGDSFYFIADDHRLYRANIKTKAVSQVTPKQDEQIERIKAITTKWVVYGSDTVLKVSKKDGSSADPIVLVENTKTKGYKYVTVGVGDRFFFVPYSVDEESGDTNYKACVADGDTAAVECKEHAFWAGFALKKSGKLNFESSTIYAPYALVRVDDTDNYGGGTLKAIDPDHPMDDGIAMGSVEKYNFQTFLSSSRYSDMMIDGDGGLILYAKNDTNFHVDAFYMNLLKKDSLTQLTDTDPQPDVVSGRDHCHGRHCMICHNLAGGKIYKDTNGTKSAYGYKIRLDFEDGTQTLADIAKGKGENFSTSLKNLAGHGGFKANVLNAEGTVVNHSAGYYHEGVAYANCNYCHARYGQTRFDAPGAIKIAP